MHTHPTLTERKIKLPAIECQFHLILIDDKPLVLEDKVTFEICLETPPRQG